MYQKGVRREKTIVQGEKRTHHPTSCEVWGGDRGGQPPPPPPKVSFAHREHRRRLHIQNCTHTRTQTRHTHARTHTQTTHIALLVRVLIMQVTNPQYLISAGGREGGGLLLSLPVSHPVPMHLQHVSVAGAAHPSAPITAWHANRMSTV